jgi:hypothetical protein
MCEHVRHGDAASDFPPIASHMDHVNWNTELRKIVREYEGLPPERSRTQIRLQRIQEIVEKNRFNERLEAIGLYVRFGLVATLTVSLFWWPYGHQCGFPLAAFLLSNGMVIVGGAALALRTWQDRMLWPFAGSAFFVGVAWTVIALHAFPRFGYPELGSVHPRWSCTRVADTAPKRP